MLAMGIVRFHKLVYENLFFIFPVSIPPCKACLIMYSPDHRSRIFPARGPIQDPVPVHFRVALTIALPSTTVEASGFSQKMSLPAFFPGAVV